MSAKVKRRQKRERHLIKLGRESAEVIHAVRSDLEAAKAESERIMRRAEGLVSRTEAVVSQRDQELARAIATATTSAEVVGHMRTRIRELEEEVKTVAGETLKIAQRAHVADMDAVIGGHDHTVVHLVDAYEVKLGELREEIATSERRAERYKNEWEEPAKLRKRLEAKEREIQTLQTENCRLRDALHLPSLNLEEVIVDSIGIESRR